MRGSTKVLGLFLCLMFLIAPFSAMAVTSETESRLPSGDTVPRLVLGELFTGLWCGYCRYAEQAVDKIVNDTNYFDGKAVFIEWHNGDAYEIPEQATRQSYYGNIQGFPTMKIDGKEEVVGAGSEAQAETAYKQKINARPTTTDTFVEIDSMIVGNQLTVWVNATLLKDTAHSNLKLNAVLIEDENIWVGAYPIRMTARDQVFSSAVTASKKGDTARGTGTITLDPSWIVDDMAVIGWLQAGDNKEVMNSAINYFTINNGPIVTGSAPAVTMAEDTTDSSIKLDTLFTDPESDPITYYYAQGSQHINATKDGSNVVTLSPWAEWSGAEEITLQAADAANCPTEIKVMVTVTPVNDPPTLKTTIPDVTMVEGTTKADAFNLNTYFQDMDNPTLTFSSSGGTNVTVTIKASGLVTFVAPVGFAGVQTITFKAEDASALSITDEMKVTVTDVNFPPKLLKSIPDITLNEDMTDSTTKLYTYFSDVDDPVLTFTVSGNTMIDVTVATDGTLTLTPKPDWNGEETLVVTTSDGINKVVTDEFKVTVNPVNDGPIRTNQAFESPEIDEDSEYTTEKTANILFTDVDGDPLAYSLEGGDSDLTITLNNDNTVSFQPAPNWFGTKNYILKAFDGKLYAQYEATVSVGSVNDPVVIDSALPASPTMNIKEMDYIDFSIVASDVDTTDTLTYVWTVNDKTVESTTASYKFTTDYTSTGTYTVKVVVSDSKLTAEKVWTIKVTDVNRKPEVSIVNPNATDVLKSTLAVTFLADGSDPDGDTLTYQWTVDGSPLGSGKTLSSKLTGGTHTIKVVVNDGKGGTNEATTTVNVKNIKKTTGGGLGGGMGSMLYVILAIVVVAIIVVAIVAMKMKGKKATPMDQTAQVPPPPPSYADPNAQPAAPAYDPYQQPAYDPNAGYYNQGGQQPPQ